MTHSHVEENTRDYPRAKAPDKKRRFDITTLLMGAVTAGMVYILVSEYAKACQQPDIMVDSAAGRALLFDKNCPTVRRTTSNLHGEYRVVLDCRKPR